MLVGFTGLEDRRGPRSWRIYCFYIEQKQACFLPRERCYLILQGLFQRQFCGNKLEREQSRAFIPDILSKNIQGYSVTMTDGLFQQLTRCFWISSMPTIVWREGNVVNNFSLASQNQSFAYV